MALGPEIIVKFLSDTKGLVSGVKEVEGTAGGKLKKFGAIAAGAFGTAAIIGFGKASVTAAEESRVATSRLENVFRSMGDSTGGAAKAAEDYAGALSKKIGVDDESIMAAQAQLATFKDVSNETARGAGIFDRATSAAADLAAAGFGSLDTNSVQLGKALQDPVKGITALARSGVTFTKSQKDSIAAMVKSGNLLGAQKTVLGAVESQVKGTAEATATSQDKMKVAFGETQEKIGNKLLPVITLVTDAFAKYSDILIPLAGIILGVMVASKLYSAATMAVQVATGIATAAQWLWNAAISANPIMLIVLGIAALVAALVLAYQKVGWFHAAVDALWQIIQTAFHAIVAAGQWLFNFFKSNWPLLLAILTGPIGLAVLVITRHWDTIKSAAAAVFNVVKSWLGKLVDFFKSIPGMVAGAFAAIASIMRGPIAAAQAVWQFITEKFNAIVSFIAGLPGRVGSGISSLVNAIKAPINALIGVWNGLEFRIPSFTLPSFDTHIPGVGKIGGQTFGGATFGFPDLPKLARGGLTKTEGLAWLHPAEVISPLADVPNIAPAERGPAVNIEQATFSTEMDVDLFLKRVAWQLRTEMT